MKLFIWHVAILAFGLGTQAAQDPTLYQYYTSGGIHSGLSADSDQFTLNGKHFVIYGGSLHYFRVHPDYWRATLQKFRAAGLNAVQLYLPWNGHEPTPGHFDFESPFLNLAKFLEEIKLADMFAIVRIGPFICAEWEFGGFPSWLLRDNHLKLRTNYPYYMERVKLYWEQVMKIVNRYQFSTTGGPVIMLQIENEYFGGGGSHSPEYLRFLHDIVVNSGFNQLLFTSDPTAARFPIKDIFPKHDVLETANLNHGAYNTLMALKSKQKNRPAFVSEFWPGWFDAWGEKHHHTYSMKDFEHEITDILFKVNGSVNFYMFIGGTNFGFMNGDRVVTSYDYDAPLTESGNYTAKYHKTREFYHQLVATGRLPKLNLPNVPKASHAHAFGKVAIRERLPFETILSHARKFTNVHKPVSMELLNHGKDYGQRYGWVVYRVETGHAIKEYEITGNIYDRGIFLVDHHEVATIEEGHNHHFKHHFEHNDNAHRTFYYDVMVENLGRHKFGGLGERKGIQADIKVDGHVATNLTIFSLDFEQAFVQSLKSGWHQFEADADIQYFPGPAMYRTQLKVDHPADTYLLLDGWTKGNVFVNGFNLGRYWKVGPQRTLYIPAPLLKSGDNAIELFELHSPGRELHFLDHPILG